MKWKWLVVDKTTRYSDELVQGNPWTKLQTHDFSPFNWQWGLLMMIVILKDSTTTNKTPNRQQQYVDGRLRQTKCQMGDNNINDNVAKIS